MQKLNTARSRVVDDDAMRCRFTASISVRGSCGSLGRKSLNNHCAMVDLSIFVGILWRELVFSEQSRERIVVIVVLYKLMYLI